MTISGVFPPIATPFDAAGELDTTALAGNIRQWNETGLSGYVVAGSNGESVLLSEQEIALAVSTVRKAALPDQVVIAGTGRQTTRDTISTTAAAAEAGADLALVMTPCFYVGQMTSDALINHFWAVADASPIPVLIYNVPKFTHLTIAADAVGALAEHPNIVGLKDSSGNISTLIGYLRATPDDFDVMVGNAPAFLSGLFAGARGGILALANVAPSQCVAVYEHAMRGEIDQAREIHFAMTRVGWAVTAGYGIPGLKAALDLLGFSGGDPRPPLLPATDTERQAIAGILREAGLLG